MRLHRFWSFCQFVAAITVAGGYAIWKWRGARSFRQFWTAYHTPPDERVPDELAERRLLSCQNCPIFFALLRACGTPLRKELRHLGCHCHMPTKVHYKCNCWAYDETQGQSDIGWPKELNSFLYNEPN